MHPVNLRYFLFTSFGAGGKAKCAANWPTVKAATVTVVPMTTCI